MDLDITMDPESCLHRDFRSPSIPKQRRHKELNKYYSYRAVHPSWVGRDYYTLRLISSTVHSVQLVSHRLQHKAPNFHITHVTEEDEPALFETLREDPAWHSFHPLWLASEVHLAVAQAQAADIESYPIVVPESGSGSTKPNNPTHPRDIERVSIKPPSAYPPTMPTNLYVKLRVKTWTKKDNYKHATNFWWGADRRHSRGKRSYRERHLQKWNEKELGRGTRNRTSQLRWEIDGSCGILHDAHYSWYPTVYDDWMSEIETTYWDWDDENWLGTGWWDDDGEIADEGWGCSDRRTEWVDQVAVVYKVSEWQQLWCDYEGMAEFEDADGEDDTFSVGSDVIVLEHVVDLDADLDKMSDLAEVLVEGEWDVVSDASSLSGDVV